MIKKINGSDIYVFLWMIYILQDVLYTSGVINRIIQLIMLVWSVVVTVKCFTKRNNSHILRSAILLVLMYCVYGVWIIIFGTNAVTSSGEAISNYIYLQNSLNSLLPIFLFYYYSKKGMLDISRIKVYIPVILLTCILIIIEQIMIINKKENKFYINVVMKAIYFIGDYISSPFTKIINKKSGK